MGKTLFLLVSILLITFSPFAQSGLNDPLFNPDDQGYGYGDGANMFVETSAIQSDGKIIIVGSFYSYNGTDINRVARLNTDGSLDTTFNPGSGANRPGLFVPLFYILIHWPPHSGWFQYRH